LSQTCEHHKAEALYTEWIDGLPNQVL